MFDRGGRVAWLLAAFALSPVASDAGDTQDAASKTQPNQRATTEKADATAESDTEVDDALLEFLGSVDSEDSELIDYMARADERAAAKARNSRTAMPKAEKAADGVTQKSTRDK